MHKVNTKIYTVLKRIVELIIMVQTLHYPISAYAEQPEPNIDTPSFELLMFLADFETKEGDWIDPSELETLVKTDLSVKYLEEKKDE